MSNKISFTKKNQRESPGMGKTNKKQYFLGLQKSIPVERLVHLKLQDNLEFA